MQAQRQQGTRLDFNALLRLLFFPLASCVLYLTQP